MAKFEITYAGAFAKRHNGTEGGSYETSPTFVTYIELFFKLQVTVVIRYPENVIK